VEGESGALGLLVKSKVQDLKFKVMTGNDVTLLIKKILVGIVVTAVPFLILFGGLYFVRLFLN
jgi:hypothetical protein